jgi:hypothetical protein
MSQLGLGYNAGPSNSAVAKNKHAPEIMINQKILCEKDSALADEDSRCKRNWIMTSMHHSLLDDGDHRHCCDGGSHIECKQEFHSHALSLRVL